MDLSTPEGRSELDGDFRTPLGKRVAGEEVFDCELLFAKNPGTNILSKTGQCFPCLVSAVRTAVKLTPRGRVRASRRRAAAGSAAAEQYFTLSSEEKGRVLVALTS